MLHPFTGVQFASFSKLVPQNKTKTTPNHSHFPFAGLSAFSESIKASISVAEGKQISFCPVLITPVLAYRDTK